jgi:hypothetical protein
LGGRTVDPALANREKQRTFSDLVLGRETTYRGPAKWESGGVTLNVEVYRQGKYLTVAGDPARNNPAVVEQMMKGDFLNGRITSDVRYHRRNASIGDLRTAYLAAFALLGYRYVFHSVFDQIRKQIANPDSIILNSFFVSLDPETPVRRQIFEAPTPHCVVVQFDRIAVLFPIPGRSDDLYQYLSNRQGRMELNLSSALGWPRGMELREDFNEQSRLPFPSLLRGDLTVA